jgi:Asp-tRNA(Asn)/Glu-tRNA(Gln) amidotransferase C subunit
MTITKDQVRDLAKAAGIPIPEEELDDVTIAYNASLKTIQRLQGLPTEGLIPATFYPDEGE